MHIRFFYSNKDLLESLRNDFFNKSEENKNELENILRLNFCLDYPLENLKNESYIYFCKLCELYNNEKNFSALEYFALLDALFFVMASKYNFEEKNGRLVSFLRYLIDTIRIDKKDYDKLQNNYPIQYHNEMLGNYSKLYLFIISKYIINNILDVNLIVKNRYAVGNFYECFQGLINKDYTVLYDCITNGLKSANRMKLQYKNSDKPRTTGYLDFSNMFAIFGEIQFWKIIGMKLNENIINEIFMNEFKKDFKYFYF